LCDSYGDLNAAAGVGGDRRRRDGSTVRGIAALCEWSALRSKSPHFEQLFSNDGGENWEVNWISDQTRVN
jgi:hypothetical protein